MEKNIDDEQAAREADKQEDCSAPGVMVAAIQAVADAILMA